MKNWKTNTGGAVSAIIAILLIIHRIRSNEPFTETDLTMIGTAVGGAISGFAAKDHDVTGGTTKQPSPSDPPPSVVLVETKKDAESSEKDLFNNF